MEELLRKWKEERIEVKIAAKPYGGELTKIFISTEWNYDSMGLTVFAGAKAIKAKAPLYLETVESTLMKDIAIPWSYVCSVTPK